MAIERFEDLKGWQEARKLVQMVYRLTRLDISMGSCKEVQSHLYVALDQTYLGQAEFDETYRQAEVVAQLLTGTLANLDLQIADGGPRRPGPRRVR